MPTCENIKPGATSDHTYMTLVAKTCAWQINKFEQNLKQKNEQNEQND